MSGPLEVLGAGAEDGEHQDPEAAARPASYATQAEARAYVARVLARPQPAAAPRVYLIVRPDLAKRASWDAVRGAVAANVYGACLVQFGDLFEGRVNLADRIPRIAAETDAALVIPAIWRAPDTSVHYLLGEAAAAEARGVLAAGLPVFVFTPDGLATWPDVRARAAEGVGPPYLPVELDMPALPPDPLPTVLASRRALGLAPRPVPRRPRVPRVRFEEAARASC